MNSLLPPSQTCTTCGTTKAIDEFDFDRRYTNGKRKSKCIECRREYDRQRSITNKAQKKAQWERWYAANRESYIEKRKAEWAADPEGKRAIEQRWRRRNKHKIRSYTQRRYAENKEHFANLHREYMAANPHKRREYNNRRKARLYNAPGEHTVEDIARQYSLQQGKCWWCARKVPSADFHVDHLIPLAQGGGNGPDNIVIACPSCNLSKGRNMPWDFQEGRLL